MAINSYAYIYSSTESGSNAWRRCVRTYDTQVGRFNTFPKTYGFSVRCVKGDDTTTVNSQTQLPQGTLYYYQEGNDLAIVSSLLFEGSVGINFFDITGKLIFSEQLFLSEKTRIISSSVGNLPGGMYIVHLQSSLHVITGKIVIL
jgi:hypothetical protein